MRSISESLIAGMIGATSTAVGIPAADNWRSVSSRREGVAAREHFENAAHDLVTAVDRLVRIGVGADRNRARLIVWRGKLALEQFRRLRLHEQLGFEIEPRREPEIGVGRSRETIDAAVLAAAIGIDRTIEADIGRIVAGDDLARRIDRHARGERRQILETLPAVVEADAGLRLVAPGRVRQRAAAA